MLLPTYTTLSRNALTTFFKLQILTCVGFLWPNQLFFAVIYYVVFEKAE